MNEQANNIISKVNRWNARASQAHDEYLGEISMIVFGEDYDVRDQANLISDFEKLSRIWKAADSGKYSDQELIEKTKEIINM